MMHRRLNFIPITGVAALIAVAPLAACSSQPTEAKPAEVLTRDNSGEVLAEAQGGECIDPPRVEVRPRLADGADPSGAVLIPEDIGLPATGEAAIVFERSSVQLNPDTGAETTVLSTVSMYGEPRDTGEREFSRGTVTRDSNGSLVSYTLAEDDAPEAIAKRFCVYLAYLGYLNDDSHPREQAGDVMLLRPEE